MFKRFSLSENAKYAIPLVPSFISADVISSSELTTHLPTYSIPS